MNIVRHIQILFNIFKTVFIRNILLYRILYHNPTLRCDHSVIWDYGYKWIDAIQLGLDIVIMPYCEIIVYKHVPLSSKQGALIIGNNSVITTGVNIRAAGGIINIGNDTAIGEFSILIAANHAMYKDSPHINSKWNESKTGINIGNNVWIGAGSCILPGVNIGNNSVIGAGSVVTREIPANEVWAGVPAKKIRELSSFRNS